MINEVFVFADDDGLLGSSAFPNQRIIDSVESQIEDVRSLMILTGNPARERRWKLRINEEVHVGCRIAWSDWRAA